MDVPTVDERIWHDTQSVFWAAPIRCMALPFFCHDNHSAFKRGGGAHYGLLLEEPALDPGEAEERTPTPVEVVFDGEGGIDASSIITTAATTAELNTGDKVRYIKDAAIATGLDEQIEYYIWKSATDKKIALFTTADAAKALAADAAGTVVAAAAVVKVANAAASGKSHKLVVMATSN
jgi:hypothetical protein